MTRVITALMVVSIMSMMMAGTVAAQEKQKYADCEISDENYEQCLIQNTNTDDIHKYIHTDKSNLTQKQIDAVQAWDIDEYDNARNLRLYRQYLLGAQKPTYMEGGESEEQTGPAYTDAVSVSVRQVEDPGTSIVDISPIATLSSEKWTSQGVEIIIEADKGHTVTISAPTEHTAYGNRAEAYDVDVQEGFNKITIKMTKDKYAVKSQNEILTRQQNISILDVPPSQWSFTSIVIPATFLGFFIAIIYDYRRILYRRMTKFKSVFELDRIWEL